MSWLFFATIAPRVFNERFDKKNLTFKVIGTGGRGSGVDVAFVQLGRANSVECHFIVIKVE